MRHKSGRLVLASLLLLSAGACFRGGDDSSGADPGKPVVDIEFPATSPAGSEQTARVSVSNPGPGDMESVVVAFAFVGPVSSGGELPPAIVGLGARGDNPAIGSIRPRPTGISPDGVLYVFEGLSEGQETTIEFRLVVPGQPGPAANSITVYDGADPSRAAGVRLQTTVDRTR